MGMTVWIHILDGRKIGGNQKDCSWMYRQHEALDTLCEQRGVEKLSAFFDYTDLAHNLPEDDDDSERELEIDPETGWEWGIDDMNWFPAESGLRTLRELRTAMDSMETIGDMPAPRKGELLAELQDCIEQLEPAAQNDQTFHFTVLM